MRVLGLVDPGNCLPTISSNRFGNLDPDVTDVFISYKRSARPQVELIANALMAEGLEVWWDNHLVPGKSFSKEINRALTEASAVLVCWTEDALSSSWVVGEAMTGYDRGVFAAALLEPCSPPPPFNTIHAVDLCGWNSNIADEEWQKLVERLKTLKSGEGRSIRSHAGVAQKYVASTVPKHTNQITSGQTSTTNAGPANWAPRAGAAVVDSLLIFVISWPLLLWEYGDAMFKPTGLVMGPMDLIMTIVFPGLATILFWVYRSATPGYMLFHLKVVDSLSGKQPRTGLLVGRYFAYLLSWLPLGLGHIWMLFDPQKQTWHDKLSGTAVVYTKARSDNSTTGKLAVYLEGYDSKAKYYRISLDAAELEQGRATIGRDPTKSRHTIDSPHVSRLHATLGTRDGKVFIRDEGSTNGTYIGDQRCASGDLATIKGGETVSFGSVRLKLTVRHKSWRNGFGLLD